MVINTIIIYKNRNTNDRYVCLRFSSTVSKVSRRGVGTGEDTGICLPKHTQRNGQKNSNHHRLE